MKRKIRLVNKERFQTFLSIVGMTAMLIVFVVIPKPKGTIERWHDAADAGMSWNEYMEVESCRR